MSRLLCTLCIAVAGIGFLTVLSRAGDDSLAGLPQRAVQRSQITAPGSPPFHLKAMVVEATNPDNDAYKAEIEEYWVAPDKWRRMVKAQGFSETLVVNGDKASDQITGDYYPNWLRTLVNAIFDPGAALKGVDLSKSGDNPVIGGTKICRRFTVRAGVAPVVNNIFLSYCFQKGLLDSVVTPGYTVAYSDYKRFADKEVARSLREYIEPGTEVGTTVTELSEWKAPDDSLFAIPEATSRLETIMVSEETLRKLAVDPPAMQWPPIRGGKSSGVLSLYVCVDREGHVRETYALNSDNPFISDAARQQVTKWRFKPAASGGDHVQVEGILTFAYETKVVR